MHKQPIQSPCEKYYTGELEDRADYGPSFLPCGKAGGLQIRRCSAMAEIAVDDYSFTPGALALKPSGFCNVGDRQPGTMVSGRPH